MSIRRKTELALKDFNYFSSCYEQFWLEKWRFIQDLWLYRLFIETQHVPKLHESAKQLTSSDMNGVS